jgi:hypothetical protein
MRRLHLSTGAWIFASVVAAAAIIAPTAYAAVSSTVAIGNTGNSLTATVTASHQLLTTTTMPKNVVYSNGYATNNNCDGIYHPPPGKAVVVTSVTYDLYSAAVSGGEHGAFLMTAECTGYYDAADTSQADETETRIFPVGLPLPSVGVYAIGGAAQIYFTGYLVPASQLPAAAPATKLPARLTHATH